MTACSASLLRQFNCPASQHTWSVPSSKRTRININIYIYPCASFISSSPPTVRPPHFVRACLGVHTPPWMCILCVYSSFTLVVVVFRWFFCLVSLIHSLTRQLCYYKKMPKKKEGAIWPKRSDTLSTHLLIFRPSLHSTHRTARPQPPEFNCYRKWHWRRKAPKAIAKGVGQTSSPRTYLCLPLVESMCTYLCHYIEMLPSPPVLNSKRIGESFLQ